MIASCENCQAKNRVNYPPSPHGRYLCGRCQEPLFQSNISDEASAERDIQPSNLQDFAIRVTEEKQTSSANSQSQDHRLNGMKRPVLEDFGISEQDEQQLRSFEWETSSKATKVYTVVIGITVLFGVSHALLGIHTLGEAVFRLAAFIIPYVMVGSIVGSFASIVWSMIAEHTNPKIRSYNQYKNAICDYESWLRKCQEDFWNSLSGLQFEKELGLLYQKLGYEVYFTPPSGDKGVDLILKRNGIVSLVQCKATSKPVGPSVARELYGTLMEFKADNAILASLSGVTNGVNEFIVSKPITVITLNTIINMQRECGIERAA